MLKRAIDIVCSFLALLVLLPLFVVVAIVLRFTGEGEIFYRQERVGRGGRLFGVYKFATMLKNSPNMGMGVYTVRGDPRILPVGRILRKTKINELPQILNILFGDMSIVGPRPLVPSQFDLYANDAKTAIKSLTPGLTGVGSIVFRDEEDIVSKSSLTPQDCYKKIIMRHKGELEIWYSEHRSLWVDTLIIFLTVWVIVFPKSHLYYRVFRNLPEKPESSGALRSRCEM